MAHKSKIAIVLSLIIVVIITMICLLPHRTSRDLSFYGMEITSIGSCVQECEIRFSSTLHNYLGNKRDGYKELKLTLPDNIFELRENDDVYSYNLPDAPVEVIILPVYMESAQGNSRYSLVNIFLDTKEQWSIVYYVAPDGQAHYYVGSADENSDLGSIWNKWKYLCNV